MGTASRVFGWVMLLLGLTIALSALALVSDNDNLRLLLLGMGCGVAGMGLVAIADSCIGPSSILLRRIDELAGTTDQLDQLAESVAETGNSLSGVIGAVESGVAEMGSGVARIQASVPLLSRAQELGIRLFYRSREEQQVIDTLLRDYFPADPADVAKSRQVVIVGSTMRGLYQNDQLSARVQQVLIEHKAPYRFLLTHWDFVSRRQSQESRPKGAIATELKETLDWLTNKCGVPLHSIRLYYGTPTCFMIVSGSKMFLNPYPYEGVAYGSFCLEVENRNPQLPQGDDGTIWRQYYVHHYYRPWYGVPLANQVRCNSAPLPTDWEQKLNEWIAQEQSSSEPSPSLPAPRDPPFGYL